MSRPLPAVLLSAALVCLLAAPALAEDWPAYRHDSQRSGISGEKIAPPLAEAWVFMPAFAPMHAWGDPHAKPVDKILELARMRFDDALHVAVAGDRVYFGSSADGKVYALDAKTGEIRWQAYTEGPVRLAPTVWNGRVYVGSDDGNVYCFDAADGRTLWTFAAAPSPERILGNGRMISIWPVRTGVLVEDGVAYFGAGVFPSEGLYLYAVGAGDGKLLWRNDSYAQGGQGTVSPQGYMVASKEKLFVPSSRAMPAAFSRKDGAFLFHRNFSWRAVGLSGGTGCTLSGNLLFGGTEQVVAVNEATGSLAFSEGIAAGVPSEGARQVVAGKDAVYYTTGKELVAFERDPWVAFHKRRMELMTEVQDLTQQHNNLAKKKSDAAAEKQAADLQKRLEKTRAALKDFDKRESDGAKWRAACPCTDSLVLAGGTLLAGGQNIVMAFDAAGGKAAWSAPVAGRARGLAVAGGRVFASTDTGAIHCFAAGAGGPGRKVAARTVADPFPKDDLGRYYADFADRIVKESGAKRGYALVVGESTGRLALELARRTNMVIYMVEPDAKKAAAAREALSSAGVYGGKAIVAQAAPDALPWADYFANLIVCEAGPGGAPAAPPQEVLRMLKPCGGVAYAGRAPAAVKDWLAKFQKALDGLGETETKTALAGDWAKIVRGPLAGAGSWTHEYAEPGNTACSDDQLVRGPIGILWFGDPGPDRMPSRHAGNSSPLAFGGRMFVEGENVIMAYDAYNGLLLWQREIPGALRVGLKTGPSNMAADDRSLFVAVHDTCLRLDAATGGTLKTYQAPPGEDGKRLAWEYIACAGGLLFGSTGAGGAADRVFALEIESGKLRWVHTGKSISPMTICYGDGRLFFVSGAVTPQQQAACLAALPPEMRVDQRGKAVPPDVRLVIALNAETGQKSWERPEYVADCVKVGVSGGDLTTMYARNVLILCGQPWNGHFWKEFLAGQFSRRGTIALAAGDGHPLWSGRMGYRSRPLVVGDHIIAEPWSFDLYTGAETKREHPVTGAEANWQMARPGHHCGNIAAAPGALFFRSGSTAMYDLVEDAGTAHFGAQRPGCWINCIPANGVVMMPEASSGCVCPFAIQCTIVFKHRSASRVWGQFSAPGPVVPVKHLALNFGAPGDRKDPAGTLWLAYPRPQSERLLMDLNIETEMLRGGGFFAKDIDFARFAGTDAPWLFASGAAGLAKCTVPVGKAGAASANFTVRLFFAEQGGGQPGRRVFDVRLQGKTVLKDFDIAKEVGGPARALVKEFKGVACGENLVVELAAKSKDAAAPPILNAIEILRE
jgi:outer membrane protein assembly factor BamB